MSSVWGCVDGGGREERGGEWGENVRRLRRELETAEKLEWNDGNFPVGNLSHLPLHMI